MSLFATPPNQITLLYSSNTPLGKKAYAFLQASKQKTLAIDISKTQLGKAQWVEIAFTLDQPLESLLHINDGKDYDSDDCLKLIQKNDTLFLHPIAIQGETVVQLTTETELLQFFKVDTAGLNKTHYTEHPQTEPTTEGESFI